MFKRLKLTFRYGSCCEFSDGGRGNGSIGVCAGDKGNWSCGDWGIWDCGENGLWFIRCCIWPGRGICTETGLDIDGCWKATGLFWLFGRPTIILWFFDAGAANWFREFGDGLAIGPIMSLVLVEICNCVDGSKSGKDVC